MNRIQFWILIGLSGLVVVLLLVQVLLVRASTIEQNRLAIAQQIVTQGQECQTRLQQLAQRIYQVAQQQQDQQLKDLLTRQQIAINTGTQANVSTPEQSQAPTPAPTR